MDALVPVLGAAVAAPVGWLAGTHQHWLYREPHFREGRAKGRRALLIRGGVAVAALAVAAVALRPDHYDFGPALASALFGIVLVVLASTDFERRRIPDRLSYPAIIAAAALCWAWPDRSVADVFLGASFAAGVGAVLFGIGLFAGGAGGLGLGDVKLMLLIGLLLGWPAVMYGLIFGMLIAGVPGLILVLSGRRRSYFSYGPYLALGALIVLLFPNAST